MKPLVIPPAAQRDENSIQMISAWIAEKGLHCSPNVGMWDAQGRRETAAWDIRSEGGLASAAAYATGGRAITFNAAGLHSSFRKATPGDIRAHYVRGDILTTVQQWTPLPNAAGTPIPHSTRWYHGPFKRHLMESFP